MMGCSPGDNECFDGEKPAHQVTITRGFWMGQTPVTVGAYKRFSRATGRQMRAAPNFNNGWMNENTPIVNVTWDDAQAYCGWMGGGLPTEAEWEYAARAGSTEARYAKYEDLDEIAWHSQNSGGQTHDVAQKRANRFGLYDMLGNVWQWVNDWYDQNYYQNSASQDPLGASGGQQRVLRGGSWEVSPGLLRVSYRIAYMPDGRNYSIGFRCGVEVNNPSQLVIQTSPNAEVYLDGLRRGQASAQGRLVIDNPRPGEHALRISRAGKKDYAHSVSVVAGQVAKVSAILADIPKPEVRENPKDGLKYVWIPPGTFMMGCSPGDDVCQNNERPAHQVTITRGFWMGQTPVTVGAYKRFSADTGHRMPEAPNFNSGWSHENMPIVDVTWNDAQAYCGWMGGRLPSEAEWEYAARGGSTQARYGPLDEVAWYGENSGGGTHDVAQKRANAFGLYETLGHVFEWVNDWYDAHYYQSSPSQDPAGPSTGQYHILRGGSWYAGPYFRVSLRIDVVGPLVMDGVGCRCVGEANIP